MKSNEVVSQVCSMQLPVADNIPKFIIMITKVSGIFCEKSQFQWSVTSILFFTIPEP
jgi:hypothetical protein